MRLFRLRAKSTVYMFAVLTVMGIFVHWKVWKRCTVLARISGYRVKRYEFDKNHPFVFVGGTPRSGSTLMRAILDAHSMVRCGPETHIIPGLLNDMHTWTKPPATRARLAAGGVTTEILDDAIRSFLMQIIVKHGEAAPIMCNKDPDTLTHAVHLGRLFPKARFIFLIRDGRAVVYSLMKRGMRTDGLRQNTPRQMLGQWSLRVQEMYHQCGTLGPERCLPVYYEQLVLQPRRWTQRVLRFLQLPWEDAVLHHQDWVDKPGGVQLSWMELSSFDVLLPIHTDALVTWVGKLPSEVVRYADSIAPMLRVLGYDLHGNLTSSSYGQAEPVLPNSSHSEDVWTRTARLAFLIQCLFIGCPVAAPFF